MARLLALTVVALALSGCDALVVQAKPAVAAQAAARPATPADVVALHKQLDTIAGKLGTMLNAKDGALLHAKVGPTMNVFLKELQSVLKATSDKKMAPAAAMEKLQAAKAGFASLMGGLNNRQVELMKEDNAQRESLLLGVLMTKQKDPMDAQLAILKDDDFAELEVAKALVAKHNATTALYVQAAGYLDAHPNRKSAPMRDAKPSNPLKPVQAMLEKRLYALQHELQVRERLHKKKALEFAAKLKVAKAHEQHVLKIRIKREDRDWLKWSVTRKSDIAAMSEAVEGVKKGDMKAVEKARKALEQSLKNMKAQTGGFLYLIQLGHTLMERDCPYCAAQCVDKCHQAGKPYVTCLSDCADAGKTK